MSDLSSRSWTDGAEPVAASAAVPFGRWLLQQADRGGFIGQLATIAKSDRGFPKDGGPDAVRKRLGDTGADPEMFDAVDDAELDWASF
ncbi:MAG: hypothetical protein DI555_23270 [Novosphingobium pentaromativorans]|uniref:YozE SAM-like domain-containing protein n=1 Tax=Novosphingobium pentaromativorans TaxID=205844 RepID=A0A2W5PZ52_9SPHN|nr:MAG: hypothetical protein DI555_23270 [Novosphingobium pentaromativorans]